MATLVSADKTATGYESVGAGTPLPLVDGSTGTCARWPSLQRLPSSRSTPADN